MVEIPIINVEVPKPENLVWGDKYDKKKDKKKIYKILAYLAVIAALIIFFRFALLAYLYIANLPKINSYDANIERIALTDDGKQAYIKLTGGNSKEIESIKFVFRSNESEFVYETKDGIGEISYEETNSFLSYFAHPEYEGSYDYVINASDIGLDNFGRIIKVEVSIKYKDENTGEIKETKIVDSTKKSDINVVRSGGFGSGGGGSGGSSGGGSGSSGTNGNEGNTCIPSCSGKTCGSDGCTGTCGSCSNDSICVNNQCYLQGVCIDNDGDRYNVSVTGCGSFFDCNDNDSSINPDATEICGNSIDEDCSGSDLSCNVGSNPIISSLSTTLLNHDAVVTINGNGFGLKANQIPITWDNLEDGAVNNVATIGGWSSVNSLQLDSVNHRHANSIYAARNEFGTSSKSNNGYFTGNNSALGSKWFLQYWFMLDNNFDWGTSIYGGGDENLANVKIMRLWNPGSIDENFVMATEGYGSSSIYLTEYTSQGLKWFWLGYKNDMTRGVWHNLRFEYKESDLGIFNGEIRVWFDGRLLLDDKSILTREDYSQLKRPFILGFYDSWDDSKTDSDLFYIDDAYTDNTWQRVEICNNVVYNNSRHCEIQPMSAWSNNSISIKINKGSFNYGDTAYLFVVNENGNISSGYPVSFNGSLDNIYPQFSNYQDNNGSLTISGIALFNVTVVNTNTTVRLNFNGVNYSATNLGSGKYTVNVTVNSAGTYNYYWFSYGNGTSHNYNRSVVRSYDVYEGVSGNFWYYDSFEGILPKAWNNAIWYEEWENESVINVSNEKNSLNNSIGSASGGGNQAYRQWWDGKNDWGGWSNAGGLINNFAVVPGMPANFREGNEFYFGYYIYYDPNFDYGYGDIKQIMVPSTIADDTLYINIRNNGEVAILFQATYPTQPWYTANLGGSYIMPKGQWVKFDWYLNVSSLANRKGTLKGWVNDQLRWNYTNIGTINSGEYNQLWINPTFNENINGPNQRRYWDNFYFGNSKK